MQTYKRPHRSNLIDWCRSIPNVLYWQNPLRAKCSISKM